MVIRFGGRERTSFWRKQSSLMVGRSGIAAHVPKPMCGPQPSVEYARLTLDAWNARAGRVHEEWAQLVGFVVFG